jgi:hypothetical protein
MRKSRYDEAEGGEIKRWRLVKSFSAIESATKKFHYICEVVDIPQIDRAWKNLFEK